MDSPLTSPAEPADLIPARNRHQAMDWSLVLASQGLEGSLLETADGGFALSVPWEQSPAARAAIASFRAENRRWRWQRRIPSTPLFFHWGSLGWIMVLAVVAALSARVAGLTAAGQMQHSGLANGEIWRLVTATMLHGDGAHLASNLVAGGLFVGVAMGVWGPGVALFSVLLAGIAGNAAGWLFYADNYSAVGASGMVMGAIGLLSAAPSPSGRLSRLPFSLVLRTATPALLLFVLYGFSPKPNTDWIGHAGGFLMGAAMGWTWRPFRRAAGTPAWLNTLLLWAALGAAALAWFAVWRHLPRA
jgi:membrane associated rhomboid family serine protease